MFIKIHIKERQENSDKKVFCRKTDTANKTNRLADRDGKQYDGLTDRGSQKDIDGKQDEEVRQDRTGEQKKDEKN